jgi:hypothetical protein
LRLHSRRTHDLCRRGRIRTFASRFGLRQIGSGQRKGHRLRPEHGSARHRITGCGWAIDRIVSRRSVRSRRIDKESSTRNRVHERALCSLVLAPLACDSVDGACARQIRQSLLLLRLAANGGSLEVAITLTEPVRRTRRQLPRQFEHPIFINSCVVNIFA